MEGYVRSRKFQNLNYIIISFFRKVWFISHQALWFVSVSTSRLKNPFQIHIAKQDSNNQVNEGQSLGIKAGNCFLNS